MKVLHVTPYYAPAWAFGRVPADVAALAREQAALGHEVTVLTTDALAPHERLPSGERVVHGVRVLRVPNVSGPARTWLHLSTPVGMRRRARALFARDRFDIVHLHELRTIENLCVTPVIPGDVPVVVSPHGVPLHPTGDSLRRWCSRRVDERLLRRARLFIARDRHEAQVIERLVDGVGATQSNIQIAVVPDGIDLPSVDALPSRAEALAHFGLAAAPVVLFAARATREARFDLLIDAFAQAAAFTPGAQLLVAGSSDSALEAVREQCRLLPIEERVHFAGYISGQRKLAALAAADVYAQPVCEDDPPRLAIDALAAGVPVLLGSACHLDGLAESGAGLLLAGDADAWSAAIRRLLNDTAGRERMRLAARQYAERFRWRTAARATVDAYGAMRGA